MKTCDININPHESLFGRLKDTVMVTGSS